jgi:acyl dehydratase
MEIINFLIRIALVDKCQEGRCTQFTKGDGTMAAEKSFITEEFRAWIGRETAPIVGYPVSEHEIRRFCYAVDDLNPLFLDPEYAATSLNQGIIAPPMFVSVPFATDIPLAEFPPDGIQIPKQAKNVMPPLSERRMGGGIETEYFQPVRPGDVLTRKTRLADLYERTGKSGLTAFGVLETTFTNQRGEVVAIERQIGIFK